MDKVVLLGADSHLGTAIGRKLASDGVEFVALNDLGGEMRDQADVVDALTRLGARTVINALEVESLKECRQNPDRAFAVNCQAVWGLAQVCEAFGAYLVQISSDDVFAGDQETPYVEDAPPKPINLHGVTKAGSEAIVRGICSRHLILRTSGLFGLPGRCGKGPTPLESVVRLDGGRDMRHVVSDHFLSPTYTADFAEKLIQLVSASAQGVFHVTNGGACSWYEFAKAFFESSGLDLDIAPITMADMNRRAPGPRYSVLDNHRLQQEGFGLLRPWKEALKAYLEVQPGGKPLVDTSATRAGRG